MRVFIASVGMFFLLFSITHGQEIYNSTGMQITFYVPHNAPGCASSIEGCIATSKAGLDGKSLPKSLDDVRLRGAKYVTLASCPNNYGKYYNLGDITYKSAEDGQMHTVKDVVGYVHDTGGDFPNDYNRRGVHGCKKLDINTTTCYTCTSDSQAGALASGQNVSFAPNGRGVADPGAFYTSSMPGLFSSYGGLGYTNTVPSGSPFANVSPAPASQSSVSQTPVSQRILSGISGSTYTPLNDGQIAEDALVPPAASLIVQPKRVPRGKSALVSWTSVGMTRSVPCDITMTSDSGETFVGQGNEGSVPVRLEKNSPGGMRTLTMRCTTRDDKPIERTAELLVE